MESLVYTIYPSGQLGFTPSF